MSAKAQRFEAILAPVIEGLGYRCWGIEFQSQGRRSVLRIFLDDTDHDVGVDDCAKISRQVSAVLDVEDPIQTEYTLEVSSPGMDRPLFRIDQFEAWAGYQVRVRLRMAFEGRRKFEGLLKGVESNDVVIIIDEHEILLPIDAIEKANIVPVFE